MRPLLPALALLLCLAAAAPLHAQQTAPVPPPDTPAQTPPAPPVPQTPATADPAAAPPAAVPPPAAARPLSKGEQKALAKKQKDSDKQKREAEKDLTYLKLQGNEIVAPTLDADGKPVELAPCARKDKECQKKRKALLHRKKVGMKIENGTLTVDGWTGKARLNYDISEVKFLYVSIPGQGTVIASMEQFPNSSPQKSALEGKTLTLKMPEDHTVQISSDENLVDKKNHVVYVALDKGYTQPGRFPTLGYGSTAKAPYNWPGVRPLREDEKKISSKAPPLPSGMAVGQLQLPCQKVAPGEKPKPVKINGITMTPEACKPATPTPGAYTAGTRPPDGSGAASTGVPEDHTVAH